MRHLLLVLGFLSYGVLALVSSTKDIRSVYGPPFVESYLPLSNTSSILGELSFCKNLVNIPTNCTLTGLNDFVESFTRDTESLTSVDLLESYFATLSTRCLEFKSACTSTNNGLTGTEYPLGLAQYCGEPIERLIASIPTAKTAVSEIIVSFGHYLNTLAKFTIGLGCAYCEDPEVYNRQTIRFPEKLLTEIDTSLADSMQAIGTTLFKHRKQLVNIPSTLLAYLMPYQGPDIYSLAISFADQKSAKDIADQFKNAFYNNRYYWDIVYSKYDILEAGLLNAIHDAKPAPRAPDFIPGVTDLLNMGYIMKNNHFPTIFDENIYSLYSKGIVELLFIPSGLSGGAIAGIVIGSLLGATLLGFMSWWGYRKYKYTHFKSLQAVGV